MDIRAYILISCLLLVQTLCPAQSGKISQKKDVILTRGDSLLGKRYWKNRLDTLFITRPGERLTLKITGNASISTIEATGVSNGTAFKGNVHCDPRSSFGFSATYWGITLGASVNPMKLSGRNRDNTLSLSSYGNRMGIDFYYVSSKTYNGDVEYDGINYPVGKGNVSQRSIDINAYYALNWRKFSTPAAFSQTYIQRRSAGSILLGASLDGQITDISGVEPVTGSESRKLEIRELGIGAGYGYNLVSRRGWLFHLSTLPTFNVYEKAYVETIDGKVRMPYQFPSITIIAREAVIYSWGNRFMGATALFNFSVFGKEESLQLRRENWRVRIFYGLRF